MARVDMWRIAGLALVLGALSSTANARSPEAAAVLKDEAAVSDAAAKPAKQSSKKREAAAPPAAHVATPPMWRLADADTEIILLGTFHVLPKDIDWRSDALGKALDEADEIWFEAEVDTPAASAQTAKILKAHGFNKPGVALSSLLTREDAAKLAEVATSLKIPMAALEPMRPWQAFLLLSLAFITSEGFDPGSGLETKLLAEGRARDRRFVFLETVEQQLGLFTKLPPKVEKSLLELTLREWDAQAAEFDTLFEAWKAGDLDTIDAVMNQSMRESAPEVYEVLLTKRNLAWTSRLEEALKSPGRKLVAVGAAHLAGADSVPALLAEKGFDVARYGAPEAANDNAAASKSRQSPRLRD